MRTLLFIAYYLPPMGSSGVQRPLNLLRHLPKHGWNPVVLAPETGMYHTLDHVLGQELDSLDIPIYRVKSRTPFHYRGGRAAKAPNIPEGLAKILRWVSAFRFVPDNKVGWIDPAFELAKQIIDEHRPALVFATSPPPSNLMLAAKIRKCYGLPTVFDFRDDWLGNHQQIYPTPWHRKKMRQLEDATLRESDAMMAVNSVIRDALQLRHTSYAGPIVTVPSGYDAGRFRTMSKPTLLKDDSRFTVLYSGRFYGENQPDVFLKAVSSLSHSNNNLRHRLRLAFQGGLERRHFRLIESLGLTDLVVDLGYVDHPTSVANLMESDLLWLIAAHRNRGEQVSTGKVYEYMASGKPVLALAPSAGSLNDILQGYGPYNIASPTNTEDVKLALETLILAHDEGTLPSVNKNYADQFSFESMAGNVARLFDTLMRTGPVANPNG